MNRQTDRVRIHAGNEKRLYHFGAEHAAGPFWIFTKGV